MKKSLLLVLVLPLAVPGFAFAAPPVHVTSEQDHQNTMTQLGTLRPSRSPDAKSSKISWKILFTNHEMLGRFPVTVRQIVGRADNASRHWRECPHDLDDAGECARTRSFNVPIAKSGTCPNDAAPHYRYWLKCIKDTFPNPSLYAEEWIRNCACIQWELAFLSAASFDALIPPKLSRKRAVVIL